MTHPYITFLAAEREEGVEGLLPDTAGHPSSFIGNVHSVYRSTINIADNQGIRLSLGVRSAVLGPNMVVIDEDLDFTSLDANIKPGKQVKLLGDILILSESIRCDLSAADVISLNIPAFVGAVKDHAARDITDILQHYGKSGGAGQPWLLHKTGRGVLSTLHEKAFYQELVQLFNLLSSSEEETLYEHMASLIGMGIGLTPTADDFVTGCFSVLLAGHSGCREWVPLHGDCWLDSIKGRTTFLGYEMLRQVLAGKVNQAALDVLHACFCPEAADLEKRVRRLLTLGSTSGTDMLAGMAFGLETLHVWKRR